MTVAPLVKREPPALLDPGYPQFLLISLCASCVQQVPRQLNQVFSIFGQKITKL